MNRFKLFLLLVMLAAGLLFWAVGGPEAVLFWIRGGDLGTALRILAIGVGETSLFFLDRHPSFEMGMAAGGLVLAAQASLKGKPAWGWMLLSLPTFLPPAAWWVYGQVADFLHVAPSSWKALLPWGAGVVAGVLMALAWLRWGMPAFDAVGHRFSRKTALERNRKTDVRDIRSMLPAKIGQYDPVRHMRDKAMFIGLDEDRRPVEIDGVTWQLSHVLLSGRTRSGKGVAAQVLLSQAIRQGELVVVLDPKGDEWMPHVFHKAAREAGRPYRFVDLRPGKPAQIAPFAQASAEEIEIMLIAAFSLSEKGEAADFYRLADRKAAREAATALAAGAGLREALAAHGSDWMERAPGFHAAFEEMAGLDAVNAADTDWRGMAQEGGCLYVVGDMINTRVVRMQRLLAVRLMLLAKRLQEENAERQTICLFADEFKVHISRPFMTALGAAAGWGLHCVLAFQSLQDLADCPADLDKDAVRGAVMENCAIQLSYAIKDPETAEWLARSTGKIQVDDEMRRVERNIALSETVLPEADDPAERALFHRREHVPDVAQGLRRARPAGGTGALRLHVACQRPERSCRRIGHCDWRCAGGRQGCRGSRWPWTHGH
jgi:hypothetical protein